MITTNQSNTFAASPLRHVLCFLFLVSGVVAALAALASLGANNRAGSSGEQASACDPVTLLAENFDSVIPPALPPGWASTTWVTSNSGVPTPPADTPPNGVFVDDPVTISDKCFVSPSIFLVEGGEPIEITFRNNFNLQDGFDGGLLEMSTDGESTFQDILTLGSFVTGGYNGTISTCCGNPLAGRQAWTGNSGGFITTTVNLPVSWGPSMILRWRMGSDSSVSGEGWRIDTVVITQCHKRIPTPPRATPRPRPTPRHRLTQPALYGNWRGTNVHGPPTPTPQPRVTPWPRPVPTVTPTAHGTPRITPLPRPISAVMVGLWPAQHCSFEREDSPQGRGCSSHRLSDLLQCGSVFRIHPVGPIMRAAA